MAGNATFESASASSSELGFSGSYLNGQRGIRSAALSPNLDRSSHREGYESKVFGSGFSVTHGGSSSVVASDDFPTLSQCMSLEPIAIGDQIKCHDELQRVLGVSVGGTAEDNSFGSASAHMKDVKRFRSSVVDTCVKARERASKMDERLHRLDKYCDVVTSKKQQRSELAINDRAGALNMKMGTQIHNINQRVEDRPKNILLNKRVRTSVAESRAKDGNFLEENGGEPDLFEKIRKLAAGGEGWDKKVKRKRSVGTAFTRSNDNHEVPKRGAQNKIIDERGSPQHDAHISRLNNREGPNPLTKNKPLRTARIGSMAPHVPGTLESWENATDNDNKLSHNGDNNRKRSMPVSQWAGQRPQKMSRARRPNTVSNASNQDEKQLSFESGSPSIVTNDSPISKNSSHKLIVKIENVQSPLRLSESEESFGGGNRLKHKEMRNNKVNAINVPIIEPFVTLPKKNKPPIKKNGSKPGRRLKKLSDRKDISHYAPLPNSSTPTFAGASENDREELLAAVNSARIASHVACSSPFWKKMEPIFASIKPEDRSFISQQIGLQDSVSDAVPCGARNTHMQHENNDINKKSNGNIPLYQRVLSALIIEDDIIEHEECHAINTQFPQSFTNNGSINSSRSCIINNNNSIYEEDMNSGLEQMCPDGNILLELQSIGICPDIMPDLDDKESESIQHEIDKLKTKLHQQEAQKKVYLEKIRKRVGNDSRARELETIAMDKLVELAYRKFLATGRNPRTINKVPKHVALAFGKRTLARCRKFQKLGKSCFHEPPYYDLLLAPVEIDPQITDDEFIKGKKKELLLDDVGTAAIRPGRKPKPKQKTAQLPTTTKDEIVIKQTSTTTTHPVQPSLYRTSRLTESNSKNAPIDDLDPIIELGIGGDELGGAQDINSFLNFDDQDLEEDFAGALDIPMDDISELMF